jgi:hypothetical protein
MIMNGLTADFLENQKYFPDVEERKQEDRSNLATHRLPVEFGSFACTITSRFMEEVQAR